MTVGTVSTCPLRPDAIGFGRYLILAERFTLLNYTACLTWETSKTEWPNCVNHPGAVATSNVRLV